MKKILGILIFIIGAYLLMTVLLPLPREVNEASPQEGEVFEEERETFTLRENNREICVGEYCDGHMSGETNLTTLYLPLLSSGGDVGCGSRIILAPHVVTPKTTAVLDASYRTLFELKPEPEIIEDDIRNVVGWQSELHYHRVVLAGGVAKLYLTGRANNLAHCALPDFQAQIETTAFQFATVGTLEVYLNNRPWDWCPYRDASPEDNGCDHQPQLWIAYK